MITTRLARMGALVSRPDSTILHIGLELLCAMDLSACVVFLRLEANPV